MAELISSKGEARSGRCGLPHRNRYGTKQSSEIGQLGKHFAKRSFPILKQIHSARVFGELVFGLLGI